MQDQNPTDSPCFWIIFRAVRNFGPKFYFYKKKFEPKKYRYENWLNGLPEKIFKKKNWKKNYQKLFLLY